MSTLAQTTRFTLDRDTAGRLAALTPEQEASLARGVRRGDRSAVQALVRANLRHVLLIAQEYRRWGVPVDDLVQQGCLGLLKAAERFDPSSVDTAGARGGGSLKAYATYWIRAEIRDYVVRSYRIVRLGTTRTERRAVRAFRTSAVQSVDELSARSGMPRARCEQLWPLLARADVSLDASPSGGTGASGVERLPAALPDPESAAIARDERERTRALVTTALGELSERERRIVWSRLASEAPETLEQIGKRLGVSRERVRQLESRACEKLRRALAPAA